MANAVRIGRVRWKAPIVGQVQKRQLTTVQQHIREWADLALSETPPPDAYCVITLNIDPDNSGHPDFAVNYCTSHDRLTLSLLAEIAPAILRRELLTGPMRQRILNEFGINSGWEPTDEST